MPIMGTADTLTWRTGGPHGGHKRSVSATTAGNSSAWAMSGAGRASAALQYMPTRTPHLKSSKSFSSSHAGASLLSFPAPVVGNGAGQDTDTALGDPRHRVTVDSRSGSRATTSMPAPSGGGGDGAAGAGTREKDRRMLHPFAAPFRFPAAPGPDAGCGFAAGRREAAAAAAATTGDAGRHGISGSTTGSTGSIGGGKSVERRNDMSEAVELGAWEKPSSGLMSSGEAGASEVEDGIAGLGEGAARRASPALSDSSLATVRAAKRQSGTGSGTDTRCPSCASCTVNQDGLLSASSDAEPTVTATTPPPHHNLNLNHHRQLLQFPASRSPWAQHARRLVSASSSTSSTCSSSLFPADLSASASCTSLALASSSPKHHTPSSSVSSTASTASTASVASSATTASSLSFPAPPPLSSSNSKHQHQHHRRRSSSRQSPAMPEYRHGRAASLSITGATAGSPQSRSGNANSVMPRSPPNTSHVPCKFFRQGACQAGNACPFSHDLGASAETVCKYFAKGNCKFGPKCANIHVLPDGRRVNYGKNGFTIIQTPGGDHASPTSAGFANVSQSALTSSLYHNDQGFDDRGHPSLGGDNGNADTGYSLPSSTYGSPRDGFAFSPATKNLSILDVPLPASFDSNGISNAARFPAAPWPSSVPSKFGIESPAASLSNAKDARTSETLKLLHNSAFGGPSDYLGSAIGSPPNSQSAVGEEFYGKRMMHSARYTKPKMLSSSVPKTSVDRDWDAGFDFGDDDDIPENYVPENLQELLTPAEKARRGSMRGENDVGADILTKYGSPIGTSPSRWGPLFQRQKEEEELSRSARAVSAFGHVGSPLRNSTLAQEMNKGNLAGSIGSNRPSMRIGSDSMSVLSQQLQDSRLDDASNSRLHPSSARGPAPIGKERAGIERHVSTGSINSAVTGRLTTPIDEEDSAFVFSMEEEDEPAARMRKRTSAGLGMASYAGVAAAAKASSGKEAKPTAPAAPTTSS